MQLTELKQMEGRTVKRAITTVCDEGLLILFTDDSFIQIESRQAHDMTEVAVTESVSEYDMRRLMERESCT